MKEPNKIDLASPATIINILNRAAVCIALLDRDKGKIRELYQFFDDYPLAAVIKHHFNPIYRGLKILSKELNDSDLTRKISCAKATSHIRKMRLTKDDIAAVTKNFMVSLGKHGIRGMEVPIPDKKMRSKEILLKKEVKSSMADEDEILEKVNSAILASDHKTMLSLLPKLTKEKINSVTPKSENTLLHQALLFADQNTCLCLISSCPEYLFSCPNRDMSTPLHIAAEKGYIKVVQFLVNALPKDRINEKNFEKVTPIQFAAFNGHAEVVEIIISKGGVELLDETDFMKRTLFIMAACEGRTNVLQMLAPKLNKDQIFQRFQGGTSLTIAAQAGYLEAVRFLANYLKEKGWLTDNHSFAAFRIAAELNRREIVKVIIPFINGERGRNLDPLMVCVEINAKEELFNDVVNMSSYFSKNEFIKERQCVLFHAVTFNREKLVEVLLNKLQTVEIHKKWNGWLTPFQRAIKQESFDVVKVFIKKFKKNPDQLRKLLMDTDAADNTALHFSTFCNSDRIFKYLLHFYSEYNLNLNRMNKFGFTPLRAITMIKHEEGIKMLLKLLHPDEINKIFQLNCSIDQLYKMNREYLQHVIEALRSNLDYDDKSEKDSWTIKPDTTKTGDSNSTILCPPFQLAVRSGEVKIAKLFLESNKVKIDLAFCGATALHYAVGRKQEQLIQLLLRFNADVNIKEEDSQLNALEMAYESFPPDHDILEQLKKQNKETEVAETDIKKTPKKIRSASDKYQFKFIDKWNALLKEESQLMDQSRSECQRVPPTLEDKQKDKLGRYQTHLFEEKNFSSNQTFHLTPKKIKTVLEQNNYYPLSSSTFSSEKPVYIHVTDDAILEAEKYGAWERNKAQLKGGVKYISGGDSDQIGIKRLSNGRHELANKAGHGIGDVRLYALTPFKEATIRIMGRDITILVLTLDHCAKSHKELQRKSRLPTPSH